MTREQRQWASQHDWYITSTPEGSVIVSESENDNVLVFTNYKLLRDWAGY